jgi:small-conductance mechanosensitive channel
VGDFVELDNGMQGFVADIGWRSTLVRELANNTIVVPNAKLAEMIVRNYGLPDPEMGVVVTVPAAYEADLDRVERVTLEVARDVLRTVEAGVAGFEPFVRFAAYGDSAVQMNVILRARTSTDRYLLTSEFLRRLHARYRSEGISIPFPQRVVHTLGGPARPAGVAARDDG